MLRRVSQATRAFALVLFSLLLLMPWPGHGQVPTAIGYQGSLTDASGTPATDTLPMVFALYDAPEGGTALWSETQTVAVANGIFSVRLGLVTPFPPDLFTGPRYLGVKVGSDAEMTPRLPFDTAPFAFSAEQLVACPEGQTNCAGTCIDLQSDPDNCGTCGLACAFGEFCSGGSCAAVLSDGSACTQGSQCQSENCVDGVCCDTTCGATCQSCGLGGSEGTCSFIPAGTDPDAECAASEVCDGAGACAATVPDGSACTQGFECQSGNCVDGFCCDSTCGATCRSCGLFGAEGVCSNIPFGTDPDDECPAADFCDGAGACTAP
jgi:hypothetical protein